MSERKNCGECGELIIANEPTAIYDNEICHISCAAEARDEADFDLDLFLD